MERESQPKLHKGRNVRSSEILYQYDQPDRRARGPLSRQRAVARQFPRAVGGAGDGVDVRDIRERLELDSGYLSRLLRSLERKGLVTVDGSSADSRVRTVQPTDAGRAERAELDRRSDELAASVLAPLSEGQRNASSIPWRR